MKKASQFMGFICVLSVVFCLFSMIVTSVGGQSSTTLYVDPPEIGYWIPACGKTFEVNVSIADVSDLWSFEFKLYWNTTLLDLVEAEIQVFLNPLPFPYVNEINEALGRYWLNMTTLGNPPGADGSGALVILTFQITYEPVWPENATEILDLADTKLADSSRGLISHIVEDGEYWCFHTSFLSLTAMTDKPVYNINETIQVHGNLTLGVSPVQDGLVALEIDDPQDGVIVIRTLSTGVPPGNQMVEIVDVIPCGGAPDYNPRSWFYRGTWAYFNVSIKNNDVESRRVLVACNVYDVNLTTQGFVAFEKTVASGSTVWGITSFWIDSTAAVGDAEVYASAFTGWPRDDGTAYCPEELATFEIRESGGAGAVTGLSQSLGSSPAGPYNLTFKLSPDAGTGIYRVCVGASHQGWSTSSRSAFGVGVILVPDHYSTIQAAVNAATPTNNSILVKPDVYNEQVTINKTLTLVARDMRAGRAIIKGSGTGIVVTVVANNVMVSGFTMQNSGSLVPDSGVALESSSGCTLSENTILMNYYGINVHSSDNNFILDNRVLRNNYGVYLNRSTGNNLGNNYIGCNKYNFGVFGDSVSDFTHIVGTSNTVNGKPVIYWVDQHYSEVPSNAGFVAIVDSTNIFVRGLDLTKNIQGVLFAFTSDSIIERVNTLGNEYGIYLTHSYNNLIIGGEVSNNFVGIYQENSDGSIICHNNFINNTNQTDLYQSSNTWDDGAGKGNYWSDYTGVDDGSGGRTAGDGVGDTLLPHQNVDWYPLMNPWILVYDVSVTAVTSEIPYDANWAYPVPNWHVNITVTVKNEGDSIETFDVSVYENTTVIHTREITLSVRSSTTFTIKWNLNGVTEGKYSISAKATKVPGETDTADNTYTDGTVRVNMVGDTAPEFGLIDIVDVVTSALAYGSAVEDDPETPWDETENWNPVADINCDGIIDIVDLVFVAIHFGESS